MAHISILSKVAYYGNYIRKHKESASKTRIDAGRLGEKSQYQILYPYQNRGRCRYKAKRSDNSKNRQVVRCSNGGTFEIIYYEKF